MANVSVEKRLQALQEKREAIDVEIKKVQTEKARDLRKRQQRREALVGKVIYQLIESGAAFKAGPWSEDELVAFMDEHLTTGRDRRLFGLAPVGKKTDSKSLASKRTKPKTRKDEKPKSQSAAKAGSNSASKSAGKFPTSSNQDELMNEFNL